MDSRNALAAEVLLALLNALFYGPPRTAEEWRKLGLKLAEEEESNV